MIMPLLSVVIPVYNVEKYLRECLDSIVNQTYTNLEIIIVNDCSPDNSEEIVLEYQAKDPRIKYIKHEKNLGQGGARNTGIQNATGEWITFVDSDDYIDLDTYQVMMDLIQKNNVDVGMFDYICFDDITKREFNNYWSWDDVDTSTLTKVYFRDIRNGIAWNKIFRLSDIINNDITFPEHLKFEDEEFWSKFSALIEPTVIGCPKRFYHYRQREGSTMSQYSFRADMGYIAKNIYDFLVEKNIFDKYQERFLKHIENWGYVNNNIPTELRLKLLTVLHDLLQNFSDEDLAPYTELLAIKNLPINEHSLEFLKEFRKLQNSNNHLQNDKWYKFGQLSRKNKIKFLIKTIIKRILKKLRLFEFAKSIRNKLSGR